MSTAAFCAFASETDDVRVDRKYYAAKYDLTDKTDGEIKTDWKTVGLADDTVAPDCRQASAEFSLNVYAEQNPGVAQSTGGNCKKLMVFQPQSLVGTYELFAFAGELPRPRHI